MIKRRAVLNESKTYCATTFLKDMLLKDKWKTLGIITNNLVSLSNPLAFGYYLIYAFKFFDSQAHVSIGSYRSIEV
jgi:hypothetical protein